MRGTLEVANGAGLRAHLLERGGFLDPRSAAEVLLGIELGLQEFGPLLHLGDFLSQVQGLELEPVEGDTGRVRRSTHSDGGREEVDRGSRPLRAAQEQAGSDAEGHHPRPRLRAGHVEGQDGEQKPAGNHRRQDADAQAKQQGHQSVLGGARGPGRARQRHHQQACQQGGRRDQHEHRAQGAAHGQSGNEGGGEEKRGEKQGEDPQTARDGRKFRSLRGP